MVLRDCFDGKMPKCWNRIFLSATNTNPEVRYQTVEKLGEAIRHRHLLKTLVIGVSVLLMCAVFAEIIWAPVANVMEEKRDNEIPTFFQKLPPDISGLSTLSSRP